MKGEKPLRAAVCFSKLTSLHVKLKFKIAFLKALPYEMMNDNGVGWE